MISSCDARVFYRVVCFDTHYSGTMTGTVPSVLGKYASVLAVLDVGRMTPLLWDARFSCGSIDKSSCRYTR